MRAQNVITNNLDISVVTEISELRTDLITTYV